MTTFTWVQSDVDTLAAALKSGIMLVEYEGPPRRKIQYQSLAQMEALLAKMVAQVAAAAGQSSFVFLGTSKGQK